MSAFVGGIAFAVVLIDSPQIFLGSSRPGGITGNPDQSGSSPLLGAILWLVVTVVCFLFGFAVARILGWFVLAAVPRSESTEEKLTHESGRDG